MEISGWLLRGFDGKEHGPVGLSTLKRWISEKRGDADSYILAPGENEWKTVSSFPELKAYLEASLSELLEKNKKLEEELLEKSRGLEKEKGEKIILEQRLKEKEFSLGDSWKETSFLKEDLSRKLASLEQGLGEKDVFSHHLKMILTLYDIIKQTERDIVSELQSLLTQIKIEKLKQVESFSREALPPQVPPRLDEPFTPTRPYDTQPVAISNKEDNLTNIFLILSLSLMLGLLGYILTKYLVF